MFNSPMLEVALGLVVAFLLLSLVSSVIVEYVLEASRARGKLLREHIVKLLGEPAALLFYADPHVVALASGTPPAIDSIAKLAFESLKQRADAQKLGRAEDLISKQIDALFGKARLPSAIPESVFADVVLGWLRDPDTALARPASSASIGSAPVPLPGDLIDAWDNLYRAANGDEAALHEGLRSWYTHSTERLTGHFRRRARRLLFLTGIALAVLTGADTLSMVNRLYADQSLRSVLGDSARALEAACPTGLADCELEDGAAEEVNAQIKSGFDASARELFGGPGELRDSIAGILDAEGEASFRMFLLVLAGYLTTVLAISLGADFWFSVLQRLLRIQANQKKAASADVASDGADTSLPAKPTTPSPPPERVQPALEEPRAHKLPLLRDIQYSESRISAWLLGHLSALAYLTEPEMDSHAGVANLRFINRKFFSSPRLPAKGSSPGADGAEAWCFESEHACVVAFRGTEKKLNDILTDLKFQLVHIREESAERVHAGFKQQLSSLWPGICAWLSDRNKPVFFTGHSLGGALAVLAAHRWSKPQTWDGDSSQAARRSPVAGVYTFGQPRVGNEAFAEDYRETLSKRTFRYVNHSDIVPTLPPPLPLKIAPKPPSTPTAGDGTSSGPRSPAAESPPGTSGAEQAGPNSNAPASQTDPRVASESSAAAALAPETTPSASEAATQPPASEADAYTYERATTGGTTYSHVGLARYFDSIGEVHTHYAGWLRLVDRYLTPLMTNLLSGTDAGIDFRKAAMEAAKDQIRNHYMAAYLHRLGQMPEVQKAWREAS